MKCPFCQNDDEKLIELLEQSVLQLVGKHQQDTVTLYRYFCISCAKVFVSTEEPDNDRT